MLPNLILMVWSSTILSSSEVLFRKMEFLRVRGGLLFNLFDSSWYILILSFKLGNLIDAIGDLFCAAACGELLAVAKIGLMSLLTRWGESLLLMVSLVRLYRLFNLMISQLREKGQFLLLHLFSHRSIESVGTEEPTNFFVQTVVILFRESLLQYVWCDVVEGLKKVFFWFLIQHYLSFELKGRVTAFHLLIWNSTVLEN